MNNISLPTRITSICLFLLFIVQLSAQDATVRGKVLDGDTGEPLLGAAVAFYQDGQLLSGTDTDLDGVFSIDFEPGSYLVEFSYIGYLQDTIEIALAEGVNVLDDIILYPVGTTFDEIVVTAQASRSSDKAITLLKQNSINSIDGISVDFIERTGDPNIADAVQRVTGVSVEGGKYINIRGLGDRYSKTLVNGIEIPALDPDRNAAQLDIFPSSLVDNIIIYKNFTPDLPGSFTGGLAEISTKSHPERFQLEFSASVTYNPQSNLEDDFLTHQGGGLDFLGIDDGTRELPGLIQDIEAGLTIESGLEPGNTIEIEGLNDTDFIGMSTSSRRVQDPNAARLFDDAINSFNDYYSLERNRSGLNQNYQFSVGNQFEFLNKPLGFIIGLSYRTTFTYRDQFTFQTFGNAFPRGEVADFSNLTLEIDSDIIQADEEVLWGGIVGLSYKLSDRSKLSLTYFHNQSGVTTTGEQTIVDERDAINLIGFGQSFQERSLDVIQLKGDNRLGDFTIDWTGSYSNSQDDQPDFRVVEMTEQFDVPIDFDTITQMPIFGSRFTFAGGEDGTPFRYFRDLNQDNYEGNLNIKHPITTWAGEGFLKFGGTFQYRERLFEEKRYGAPIEEVNLPDLSWQFTGNFEDVFAPINFGIINDTLPRGEFPLPAVFGNLYLEQTLPENSYEADQTLYAGYVMGDFPILRQLRLIGGVRYENSDINIATPTFQSDGEFVPRGNLATDDLLPSIQAIYSPREKINIRGGYARTLARPTFREFAPFESFLFASGFQFSGVDTLKQTDIDNYDLRFEWFPTSGELVSVSGFYKDLTNPIERLFTGRNTVEPLNVTSATVYGFEVEVRKDFSFLGEFWRNFTLSANYTFIRSEVPIEDENDLESAERLGLDDVRPLFGQPEYTFNAELSFIDNVDLGLQASVNYSTFGQRLTVVGINENLNVFEQPRGLLGASIRKTIFNRWAIRLRGGNLLDPQFLEVWKFDVDSDEEFEYQKYRLGRNYSIGISYSI